MGELLIWAVYNHPLDYPDKWVARPHCTRRGEPVALFCHLQSDSLLTLRLLLRDMGLICLARYTDDDPCIVESWL